jgi:predicted DsbA family dithiol-disulfide isomerase
MSTDGQLLLRVFTDPGCPFAYSAEPARLRLQWLYGDQLEWRQTMIVLAETPEEYAKKGFTPEKQAKNHRKLAEQHGMPIDDTQHDHAAATIDACRAYVAVRMNQPEQSDVFLRQLRIAAMGGKLIDEQSVIDEAAKVSGLDASRLAEWVKRPETEAELRTDMQAARAPTEVALAMQHKLAKTVDGVSRYSAPSYQFILSDKIAYELPGFWSPATYEAAIANLAPHFKKRDDAQNVSEVLAWANMPLATVEVSTITGQAIDQVRAALQKVATMTPQGQDGFWVLN